MAKALIPALGQVLPAGAGVGWSDPRADHALMPGEGLSRATPARLREFAAGRHAARLAMVQIGVPATAVPHGPDRAPVWPAGIIGSIAHTATACVAIAVQTNTHRGIGVDLEPDTPLDPALWETILVPQERAALMRLPQRDRGHAALRLFCAKEAAFKAHYPLTRLMVGFEVMAVVLAGDRFTGTFQTALPPLGQSDAVHGHLLCGGGHILALALL